MARGDLGVVEHWLSAVNRVDEAALLALTDDDVEIVGPRGSGHGKALLLQWLARAGFHAEAERWFCGDDGTVVVEQLAHWSGAPGSAPTQRRVSSSFAVRARRVARFQRFDELQTALRTSGLREDDQVLARE
jgi:hypothetical protein